jgi:putative ABC transport system permease protein
MREWEAELRSRHDADRPEALDFVAKVDLVRRAFGALPDAAWLRRQFSGDSEALHDVRHGARLLRQSPGFTIAVVVILALGIGGTVALAALLDTLIFRPLPYRDADRVVTLWQRAPNGERDDVAPANFLDWRERSRSFERIAAVVPYSYDYTGGGEPEVLFGAQVTDGFFDALGMQPLLGRTFEPVEYARGGRLAAIITYGLWQRRFAGDPAIIGKPISLDERPRTIVGVLPPEFNPQLLPRPGELSVWTPKVMLEYEPRIRDSAWWNVIARVKPGVTLEAAQAEMRSIAAALGREHPRTNERVGVEVVPLRDHLMGQVKTPLFVMLGAVLLVLAIGCANVASLMLARGMHREREFAIRSALGAGRARLVRQLAVESLLLATIASAAGIALAQLLIRGIVALAPGGVARLHEAAIDGRILALAAALGVLTALVFGILPAVQFSRPASDAIRERHASAPRAAFRRALVAAEVALAVIVLTSAGLLLRSFNRLMNVDPGFTARHVVALQVFAHDRNPTPDRVRTFFTATFDRLRQVPGVEAVGAASAMPFANANIDIRSPFEVVGRPPDSASPPRGVYVTIATAGFFRAMSIPLREGRLFEPADGERAPRVALISDSLRRREWGDASPLGQRIRVDLFGQAVEPEIVGVVSQIRHDALDGPSRPEVFVPFDQVPYASMTYVLRGQGDPAATIAAAKQAVWAVDPLQAFYETGEVEAMIDASVVRQRFSTTLVSAFAAVALLLCAIGIYGVISFATAQRTREIGVRMALGADASAIRRMVLGEGGRVVAVGLAGGLAGAALATRYLRTLLFEVSAIDPLTMGVVAVLLGVVALLACYVPARRATRVDPLTALRVE